jgi:hypothetical protein
VLVCPLLLCPNDLQTKVMTQVAMDLKKVATQVAMDLNRGIQEDQEYQRLLVLFVGDYQAVVQDTQMQETPQGLLA